MAGELHRVYQFTLQGVELTSVIDFAISSQRLSAQLKPGDQASSSLELSISVLDTEKSSGIAAADRLIHFLYRRLLLNFATNIEHSTPPRCVRHQFREEGLTHTTSVMEVGAFVTCGANGSLSPKFANIQETRYTVLRNNLIHAEERGCDPTKAIADIETHMAAFQAAVSKVFTAL